MQKNIANNNKIFNLLLYLSFITFLLTLIFAIYFKLNDYSAVVNNAIRLKNKNIWQRLTYDIIPFKTLARNPKRILKDFALNTIAFMPFGFYISLIKKNHKLLWCALFGFFFCLALETAQLLTVVGTFSSNDLIANTLGAVIGFFAFKLIKPILPPKAITGINLLIVVLVLPILLYYFSDTMAHISVYVTKKL
jgi:glycopeptide antibiotics resistance protein